MNIDWSIFIDPTHYIFEFVTGLVGGLLVSPLAKRWLKRHDETHHGADPIVGALLQLRRAHSDNLQRVERLEAADASDLLVINQALRRLGALEAAQLTRLTLDDER